VFENRVLRKMFGPKRAEVTGQWRKLRNEELYDQYSSPNAMRLYQIRKNKMNGAHSTGGGGEERCRQGFGGET